MTPKPSKPKKPRRGPTQRLGDEVIGEALRASGGHVIEAARMLHTDWSGLYKRIKASAYLEAIRAEAHVEMVELAEAGIKKAVQEGNITAMIFTLKCLGKDDGWVERQEIETSGRGGGPIRVAPAELSDEELAAIAARSRPAIARETNGEAKPAQLHLVDETRLPTELASSGDL